jgi:antitoxin ParD1/3/4
MFQGPIRRLDGRNIADFGFDFSKHVQNIGSAAGRIMHGNWGDPNLLAKIDKDCHWSYSSTSLITEGHRMPMNISLTPHLEEMIRAKIASGSYTSASEVVREALRLLEEEDQIRTLKLQKLREDIQEGLDSGPPTVFDPRKIKQAARANKARNGKK